MRMIYARGRPVEILSGWAGTFGASLRIRTVALLDLWSGAFRLKDGGRPHAGVRRAGRRARRQLHCLYSACFESIARKFVRGMIGNAAFLHRRRIAWTGAAGV